MFANLLPRVSLRKRIPPNASVFWRFWANWSFVILPTSSKFMALLERTRLTRKRWLFEWASLQKLSVFLFHFISIVRIQQEVQPRSNAQWNLYGSLVCACVCVREPSYLCRAALHPGLCLNWLPLPHHPRPGHQCLGSSTRLVRKNTYALTK